MRIAIFGGRGFIGKTFVQNAPKEHELLVLNRPEFDLTKPETFKEKLKEFRPDVVVNMAAILGTMLSSVSVRDMFATNVMGALDIAYAACEAGARSYVFTSSTTVHGENKPTEPCTRFSGFAPKHPYGASKAAAEYALQQFALEQKGMTVVSLRPPQVIGEDTLGIIPPIEFVRDVLGGKDIQIFGDGLHERDYISVQDVSDGIWKSVEWSLSAEKKYHPFFLTGNRISVKDLAEKIVKKLGGKVSYTASTKQAFSLTADSTDTEVILGWKAKNSIDDILEEVERFVRKEKK